MSGGSYDYIYYKLKDECCGRMYDEEMNDLVSDLVDVLYDLEWWQSDDTSEETYRKTLKEFKTKWFGSERQERLKGYIDSQISVVREQLYKMIGEGVEGETE